MASRVRGMAIRFIPLWEEFESFHGNFVGREVYGRKSNSYSFTVPHHMRRSAHSVDGLGHSFGGGHFLFGGNYET